MCHILLPGPQLNVDGEAYRTRAAPAHYGHARSENGSELRSRKHRRPKLYRYKSVRRLLRA